MREITQKPVTGAWPGPGLGLIRTLCGSAANLCILGSSDPGSRVAKHDIRGGELDLGRERVQTSVSIY